MMAQNLAIMKYYKQAAKTAGPRAAVYPWLQFPVMFPGTSSSRAPRSESMLAQECVYVCVRVYVRAHAGIYNWYGRLKCLR